MYTKHQTFITKPQTVDINPNTVIIAAAVSYANDRGVFHCDINPSNLLVDSAGTP